MQRCFDLRHLKIPARVGVLNQRRYTQSRSVSRSPSSETLTEQQPIMETTALGHQQSPATETTANGYNRRIGKGGQQLANSGVTKLMSAHSLSHSPLWQTLRGAWLRASAQMLRIPRTRAVRLRLCLAASSRSTECPERRLRSGRQAASNLWPIRLLAGTRTHPEDPTIFVTFTQSFSRQK